MTEKNVQERLPLHVLIVEDDEEDFLLARKHLEASEGQAFHCVRAATLNDAFGCIDLDPPDLVLLDLSLPHCDGLETYRRMHTRLPDTPIIILTGRDDEAAGVEAVKEGAQDYLLKDHVDADNLARSIRYAVERNSAQLALRRYRDHLETLIEARTSELRSANREQKEQIAKRKRAQKERETLQVELMEARRLEAVGRLAGGVAHEFNNALMPVLGHTEILIDKGGNPAETAEHLASIKSAVERLTALTRKLLMFSTTETFEPRIMDLNTLVDQSAVIVRAALGEQINLEIHAAGAPLPVEADQRQILQMFLNLAMNAREAMNDGGRLTIRTHRKDAAADKTSAGAVPIPCACVSFEDTGRGMDVETLQLAFDPFFTTKEFGPGAGLGLSVAHGIAKQHDGWIDVTSRPGGGSVFNVYLPVMSNGAE